MRWSQSTPACDVQWKAGAMKASQKILRAVMRLPDPMGHIHAIAEAYQESCRLSERPKMPSPAQFRKAARDLERLLKNMTAKEVKGGS